MYIESLIVPKKRGTDPSKAHYNEDLVGTLGSHVWLLDGASSPKRWVSPEAPVKDAQWLVRQLDATLREVLSEFQQASLADVLAECEARLEPKLLAAAGLTVRTSAFEQGTPHTTVVLLRLGEGKAEYALLQDSSLLVKSHEGVRELKDLRQDRLNAGFYEEQFSHLAAGETFESRGYNDSLDRMVDNERRLRNAGGFYTFTGLRGAAEHAVVGEVPLTLGTQFLLASDGAARYWTTFGQEKATAFEATLSSVYDLVRGAEQGDSSGQAYPRVGAEDDFSLVRVRA